MRGKLNTRASRGDECAVSDAASVDRVIGEIAERQRGVVTRAQLLATGIETGAIERRIRAGRLHAIHRGVYVVGHRALADGARELAAILACGGRAVLSHLSAARLLKLLPYPAQPGPVDVTVIGRQVARRAGINIHRVRAVDRGDVRLIDGIWVTTPARTLLDLAATVPAAELERAFAEAQVLRLVDGRGIANQLARNPGRSGVRALRALIDAGSVPTRNDAERRMLRLIRSAGLPRPKVNARVGQYEVDFLWPEHRLVVEFDGYASHGHRRAFERDRERDAALAAAGYTVIRVTWRQLVDTPEAVVARIAQALAVRGTQ